MQPATIQQILKFVNGHNYPELPAARTLSHEEMKIESNVVRLENLNLVLRSG